MPLKKEKRFVIVKRVKIKLKKEIRIELNNISVVCFLQFIGRFDFESIFVYIIEPRYWKVNIFFLFL